MGKTRRFSFSENSDQNLAKIRSRCSHLKEKIPYNLLQDLASNSLRYDLYYSGQKEIEKACPKEVRGYMSSSASDICA